MRLTGSRHMAMLATAAVFAGGCGSAADSDGGAAAEPTDAATKKWAVTTDPADKPLDAVKWNLYYEPTTIDPLRSANYAENQVLSNLCESLQQQAPDFKSRPGLATASNPSPTTWVYDIAPAARFWNGKPVTADDVVYSMERHLDPEAGSYWSFYYTNVKSVRATGDKQVTVSLKRPDYVFPQGMATAAGAIVEEADARKAGDKLGSSSAGLMCSGPFEFDRWTPGNSLVIRRNDDYWKADRRAKAESVTFSFLADDNSQTNALVSGSVDGEYQVPFSAVSRLEGSTTGKSYKGQSLIQYNLMVASKEGPLEDTRVRQALSMAIDREGIARTAFGGAAAPARTLVSLANYGYADDVYQKAWDSYGAPEVDLEGAKRLVAEAKPSRPIVLAYPTGAAAYHNQVALAVQSAGKSIGLEVELKGIPNDTYQGAFGDPKVTKGVDLVEFPWFLDVPEPVIMYQQFLPENSLYNLSGYRDDVVTRSINAATGTKDPVRRAELVVQAQDKIVEDLPWIPVVQIANTLYMNNRVSGAPASFVQNYYPWAADLGGR